MTKTLTGNDVFVIYVKVS